MDSTEPRERTAVVFDLAVNIEDYRAEAIKTAKKHLGGEWEIESEERSPTSAPTVVRFGLVRPTCTPSN